MGGIQFPIGFFDRFFIPVDALWWGLAMGGGAALLGSFAPAWSARNVKVADVFSKVA
jgi:putative ABC transport system permease protein